MDPEVKRYFVKILSSFSMGLLWMFTIVTAGLYFKLGLVGNGWHWYNGLFYGFMLLSFAFLLRYYYRTWRQSIFGEQA